MSTTITITKSIDVDIELTADTRYGDSGNHAVVATVPATTYDDDAREVARVGLYQSDDRPDGSAKFTVTGNFVGNYAVEAKVRKAVEGSLTVQFDSESGQFFAYVRSFDAAIILARKVAEAAVEVALEAGEL
jgi:hypothetical protein